MLEVAVGLQVLLIVGVIICGLFLKSYFPSYLDQKGKNLATKEDIADLTTRIESVKIEFTKSAAEHQIQFSKLHEKRTEVIVRVYRLLVQMSWAASDLASPFQFAGEVSKKEKRVALDQAIVRFYRFYALNRVLLPPHIYKPLEEFAKKIRTPTIHYGVFLDIDEPNSDTMRETEEARKKLYAFVEADVPSMIASIEAEFRNMLGMADVVAGG